MKLSQRIGRVGASPTLAISAKAKAMRREGKDVIGFGAGEPDFDTPNDIKDAARDAMKAGKTKYSPPAGEVDLRQGLIDRYKRAYGLEYSLDQVFVSNGGKHTLFNLFSAMLDPGDEVICVAPYWVSYPAQVLLADGKPVVVETTAADNFCPTPAALDAVVTAKTRCLVLNSPGNPTGAVWSRDQLEALVRWLREHPDVMAIYDGIYSELIYGDGRYYELAALDPAIEDQVVCVSGVSKTYAMTGWRIGWALGPLDWVKGAAKFQSQTTSGPNTVAQWAALAALSLDPEIIASMRKSYDARRLLTCHLLEDLPHVELVRPEGAFYAFPNLSTYIGGHGPNGVIKDDLALATYLLDSVGVALVPGSAFGAPGFVRITYACDENTIQRGIERIADALEKVHPGRVIRVIAGTARGRQLVAPKGLRVRPTPAKVREALFSIIADVVPDAAVLDLFCGAGTLGIEALSRGAARATFVDASRRSVAATRANLERIDLAANARTLKRRLPGQIATIPDGPYDLILSDPPYADDVLAELARELLAVPGLVAPGAVWAHELPSRALPDASEASPASDSDSAAPGWRIETARRYGNTGLVVLSRDS